MFRQGALEGLAIGQRARRHDDFIGAEGLGFLAVKRRVEQHLHLQLGQLALEPVEVVDDLVAARCEAGQAELAAELVRGFGERHLVAAFGGNTRGFQARNAAANDQHLLRFRARPRSGRRPIRIRGRRWD